MCLLRGTGWIFKYNPIHQRLKHHTTKAHKDVPSTSALDWRESSALGSGLFTSGQSPQCLLNWRLCCSQALLKRRISSPCRKPTRFVGQPACSLLTIPPVTSRHVCTFRKFISYTLSLYLWCEFKFRKYRVRKSIRIPDVLLQSFSWSYSVPSRIMPG